MFKSNIKFLLAFASLFLVMETQLKSVTDTANIDKSRTSVNDAANVADSKKDKVATSTANTDNLTMHDHARADRIHHTRSHDVNTLVSDYPPHLRARVARGVVPTYHTSDYYPVAAARTTLATRTVPADVTDYPMATRHFAESRRFRTTATTPHHPTSSTNVGLSSHQRNASTTASSKADSTMDDADKTK